MNIEDKKTFSEKLEDAATAVGRRIGKDEMRVFFTDLIEFPLDVVTKAIDKALRDRDPEDKYIITKLLTVTEIRDAARKIMASPGSRRSGCEKCEGTTWILDADKIARRCECWLVAINSKKKETGGK